MFYMGGGCETLHLITLTYPLHHSYGEHHLLTKRFVHRKVSLNVFCFRKNLQ